jgi:hypothetical protein
MEREAKHGLGNIGVTAREVTSVVSKRPQHKERWRPRHYKFKGSSLLNTMVGKEWEQYVAKLEDERAKENAADKKNYSSRAPRYGR